MQKIMGTKIFKSLRWNFLYILTSDIQCLIGPDNDFFQRKIVIIFLPIN